MKIFYPGVFEVAKDKFWISSTVFPHIRPAGINFSLGLQVRALLEITRFHLHKSVPDEGIIRNAGIIRGRVLYEEIRYLPVHLFDFETIK